MEVGPTPWPPQPIITERLVLRAPQGSDVGALVGLLKDPQVRKYLGGPLTQAQVEQRGVSEDRWGAFVVVHADGGVIGTVSFDRKRGPWEVSYQLRPDRWGHGLATEAVRAACRWFFSATHLRALIAVTQSKNERSRRLLENLGGRALREFEEYGALQVQYHLLSFPPERPLRSV